MRAGFPGLQRGLEGAIDHTRKAAAAAFARTLAHTDTQIADLLSNLLLVPAKVHPPTISDSKKSLFSKKKQGTSVGRVCEKLPANIGTAAQRLGQIVRPEL